MTLSANASPSFASTVYTPAGFVLSLIVCWCILALYRAFLSPLASLPGPKLALIHDAFGFRFTKYPPVSLLRLHDKYGPVVRVGPNEVAIASYDEIHKIYSFQGSLPKAALYDLFRVPNVKGPMFAMRPNHFHGARRKLLNPAFSRASVLLLQPFIFEQATILCSRVEDQIKSSGNPAMELDVLPYFRMQAGDTSLRLSFDIQESMVRGAPLHPIMNLVKTEMGKPFYIPYVRPFLRRAPWLASQLPKQIVSQLWAMDRISSLTEIYMTQYLEKLGKAEVDDTVLSRMVNATDPLTGARLDTRELAAEGRSLIIAGSESTAITLAYSCWLIYQKPSVLEKLRSELETVMPDHMTLPTELSTLEGLEYFTACINEALRLYPAIHGPYPREVSEGGLTVGNYHLPQGTVVASDAYVLHRASFQANIWGEDLHAFRPERWIEGKANSATMHSALIAFGTGPRSCIGKRIAMTQLYAVLAVFVARFDAEVVSKGENMLPAGAFNLGPVGGRCVLRMTARDS